MLLKTGIDGMHFIFQGSSAPSYCPLGYWEAGIEVLAKQKCVAIKHFAWFYEGHNDTVFKSNVAIKRVDFTQN